MSSSDSSEVSAPPAPVVASIHQAIRRGSVLKPAPKPVESLSSSAVSAYTQRIEASKNEASVVKELQSKRGSILLKPTPQMVDNSNRAAKEAYLLEQEAEAELLTHNSKLMHQLRSQEDVDEPPPPPPPATEEEEQGSSSIPPPPATVPPADFLSQITPKAKLSLAPVNQPKVNHDGVNANLLALAQIEKRDLKSGLKQVETSVKDHFASNEFKERAREEEQELNKALRRNSVLMDTLRLSQPPPSYPESADDLREAQECKDAEDRALLLAPVSEDGPTDGASSSTLSIGAAVAANDPNRPQIERVRRNSKMTYLGDLTKPLARLQLNPVSHVSGGVSVGAIATGPSVSDLSRFCARPAACGTASSSSSSFPAAAARSSSSSRYVIGLMSGTSMDGVDAVLADFGGVNANSVNTASRTSRGRCIHHAFEPMPNELRQRLLQLNTPSTGSALDQGGELHMVALCSNDLARLYASIVERLLLEAKVSHDSILAIANHGQTIRHRPELGYTIQISNNALLAELTCIPVIGDFRSRDVAAGGTGAPLVPAFHKYWFGGGGDGDVDGGDMIILNLGGIANISHLTSTGSVVGFDTGPANVLSDVWIDLNRGIDFDRDGAWASSGRIDAELLEHFLTEPYFTLHPPKSTGRDLFHIEWIKQKLKQAGKENIPQEDVACTIIELTAVSVARAIQQWCDTTTQSSASSSSPSSSNVLAPVYVCGGGALNGYLLDRLRFHLSASSSSSLPRRVESTVAHGLDVDRVESMAFAWLGWEFLQGRTTNLPRVTGAKGGRVLGCYYPA